MRDVLNQTIITYLATWASEGGRGIWTRWILKLYIFLLNFMQKRLFS